MRKLPVALWWRRRPSNPRPPGFSHVLGWTLALIALARDLPATRPRSRYGIWCRLMLFVIGVALVFDVRDGAMYLYPWLAGHPAVGSA